MKQILIFLILAINYMGFSQSKNFIDQNYIEVTGRAEIYIVPDLIYLRITLNEEDSKIKIKDKEQQMINKLSEIGIDVANDLAIKDFSSYFVQTWFSNPDVVLRKQYYLTIHDAKTLQKVFFELQKIDIADIYTEKFDNTKIEQYRKEVKINAIKAAKEKAESLSSSINQTIGKAIYIEEVNNSLSYKGFESNTIKSYSSKFNSELDVDKINLEYSILVRFELK